MFQSFGLTPSRLAPGSKKCPQAKSGGLGNDFGAYFCKEVLPGIVSVSTQMRFLSFQRVIVGCATLTKGPFRGLNIG